MKVNNGIVREAWDAQKFNTDGEDGGGNLYFCAATYYAENLGDTIDVYFMSDACFIMLDDPDRNLKENTLNRLWGYDDVKQYFFSDYADAGEGMLDSDNCFILFDNSGEYANELLVDILGLCGEGQKTIQESLCDRLNDLTYYSEEFDVEL